MNLSVTRQIHVWCWRQWFSLCRTTRERNACMKTWLETVLFLPNTVLTIPDSRLKLRTHHTHLVLLPSNIVFPNQQSQWIVIKCHNSTPVHFYLIDLRISISFKYFLCARNKIKSYIPSILVFQNTSTLVYTCFISYGN